jgi:hypothetical protein
MARGLSVRDQPSLTLGQIRPNFLFLSKLTARKATRPEAFNKVHMTGK